MRIEKILIIIGLMVLVIAPGCGQGGSGHELDRTKWRLGEIGGVPALPHAKVTIEFEGDRVSGNAGCNQFFGEIKFNAYGRIEFGVLGQTLLLCMESDDMMGQETAYMQALGEVVAYEVEGSTLRLKDASGGVRLVFEALE